MMTDHQVTTVTIFLQIIGTWAVVVWLVSMWLGRRHSDRPKSQGYSFLLIQLAGVIGILLVSRAWYFPEGLNADSGPALAFSGVCSVLYVFLIAIKSLPEARHLKFAAIVTWLLVIAVTWIYSANSRFDLGQPDTWKRTVALYSPTLTVAALAVFLVVFAASDWIEAFMKNWSDALLVDQGLPSAGKWIGRFERFLILCCLLAGQPAGVAVLVTAKGILRFGEIKDDKDQQHQRKMVEYILIGSMCSYSIALSVGWIACFLIQHLRY